MAHVYLRRKHEPFAVNWKRGGRLQGPVPVIVPAGSTGENPSSLIDFPYRGRLPSPLRCPAPEISSGPKINNCAVVFLFEL